MNIKYFYWNPFFKGMVGLNQKLKVPEYMHGKNKRLFEGVDYDE